MFSSHVRLYLIKKNACLLFELNLSALVEFISVTLPRQLVLTVISEEALCEC